MYPTYTHPTGNMAHNAELLVFNQRWISGISDFRQKKKPGQANGIKPQI
jgi:hypothetical protein